MDAHARGHMLSAPRIFGPDFAGGLILTFAPSWHRFPTGDGDGAPAPEEVVAHDPAMDQAYIQSVS